jgi:two-component sensor histidine kinase
MTLAQHFATDMASPITILPPLPDRGSAREAHHRIANSLQLLSAMVSIEARGIADPTALAALDMTMRRINAIAGVQRMLYLSSDAATVDLGVYLEDLGAQLEQGCADAGAGRHVRVFAQRIEVAAEDATALGVIVSELVGNACKYAYPADAPGDVRVALRALPLGGYVLEVSDRGQGIVPDADPQGSGLGSRLIAMMAGRLGGHPIWRDAQPGTHFELYVGKC